MTYHQHHEIFEVVIRCHEPPLYIVIVIYLIYLSISNQSYFLHEYITLHTLQDNGSDYYSKHTLGPTKATIENPLFPQQVERI